MIAVEATGHAAWDDFGRDLVCAAASVLLQSLWLGCVEVLHLQVTGQKEAGKLSLRWGTDAWELPGLRALVLTTLGSLQLLAKQYPKNISVAVCF